MTKPSAHTPAVVELTAAELPATCPSARMPVWCSHPRVTLDLSHGPVACPYCGTRYQMAAGESAGHSHG